METFAETIERLRREIAERQSQLRFLILGDQTKGVSASAAPIKDEQCDHAAWTFSKQGRRCFKCGAFMVDFGD